MSTLTVGYNADRSLYEPLSQLHASSIALTDEQHAMLTSLKLDFERGGIELSGKQRDLVAALQNRAHALGAEFSSNISSASAFIDIEEESLQRVPSDLKAQMRRSVSGAIGTFSLPVTDSVIAPKVMKYVESSVRRRIFVAENSRCASHNLPVLDSLLEVRHTFAELLGFKSYGDLSFSGRLASSPDDVLEFLDLLSAEMNATATLEDALLVEAKLQANPSYLGDPSALQVAAWDRAHYMGKAKGRVFELDSSVVSEYLPLDACLNGMASVMENVFGVRMVSVPRSKCEKELWHGDVVKMELRHEADGVQGHVYLDLYPRPGKYGHAAHFCLRGGREVAAGSEYQTPVVALVCNFAPLSEGLPALLSFGEYETLWHEWGHAIHSLLSRTRYQHLSGTRVATDLVEVPSHVFEHFAWDPRVISHISAHYRTGDPMPTRLIHAVCASKHQFIAADLKFQTLYASLDLLFHGVSPPLGHTSEVAAELQKRLTNVEHVEGTAPHAAFQHFVGYGAGYYSCALCLQLCLVRLCSSRGLFLRLLTCFFFCGVLSLGLGSEYIPQDIFARILSAQIWERLFSADPFSRAAGEKLREELLCCGAARDSVDILASVLNEEPSCDAYFKSIGLDHKSSSLALPLRKKG